MATATRLTLGEFLAQPEEKPYREYIDGEVFQKPVGNRDHSFIQGFLFAMLFQFLSRTRLGRAGTEWRCIFGPPGEERAFVPDLTYVARERLTEDQYPRLAPDLLSEVLSPEQSAGRFADKIQFYLLHGVRLVWVVDPMERVVLVFRPGEPAHALTGDAALDGEDVLPGFSVPVAEIFAQIDV